MIIAAISWLHYYITMAIITLLLYLFSLHTFDATAIDYVLILIRHYSITLLLILIRWPLLLLYYTYITAIMIIFITPLPLMPLWYYDSHYSLFRHTFFISHYFEMLFAFFTLSAIIICHWLILLLILPLLYIDGRLRWYYYIHYCQIFSDSMLITPLPLFCRACCHCRMAVLILLLLHILPATTAAAIIINIDSLHCIDYAFAIIIFTLLPLLIDYWYYWLIIAIGWYYFRHYSFFAFILAIRLFFALHIDTPLPLFRHYCYAFAIELLPFSLLHTLY